MKIKTKCAFALLALVGLMTMPSTAWAMRYAKLTVVAVGEGTVAVATSGTPNNFGETKTSDRKSDTAIKDTLISFVASAKANEGFKFVGWYESVDCTGEPIGAQAEAFSYSVRATSNSSSNPTIGTIYALFVDASVKSDLADANFELSAKEINYTGEEQEIEIATLSCGGKALVKGEDYTLDPTSVLKATGSRTEDTTYTVTINAIEGSDYTGTKSVTWKIIAPSGAFESGKIAPTVAALGTFENNTLAVTDTSTLKPENGVWYAGLTFTWPESVKTVAQSDSYQYAQYVKPDAASVIIGGTPYAASGATYEGGRIVGATDNGSYNTKIYGGTESFTYLKTTTWQIALTPDILKAAEASGTISQTANIGSIVWGTAKEGDTDGVKFADYTITVDVSKTVLNDEYGNQVYPHVDFVAENGTTHKKYETLAAALDAANEGETVTLIADAEEDAFEISPGVTLDLVGFGNGDASYLLKSSEGAGATLKSAEAETVEAITGYAVVTDTETEPGVYIYTTKLAHQHAWTFAVVDGTNLVATCADPDTCTIEGAQLKMQLQGVDDKEYDGKGISPSVVDIDVGGNKFREVIEGVTVGDFTYEKPSYSTNNWYTGAYMASCVVTIGEETYTLTKDFNILPKEYNDGFVASVGGLSVRFDTLLEATTVANEGDTIYYKGGNLTGKEVTFSAAKNITLDLGGKSLKHDAYETVTLKNSGEGTVTLTNGTIVQPKASGAWGSAGQMEIKGNFAFADVETKNRATNADNFFKLTVKSGTVTVLGGQYTSQFKADGGTVVYQGGQFWDGKYNNRAYFSEPTPVMGSETGYIVIPGSGSIKDGNDDDRALVWEVVAHTHDIVYTAAGNVITAKCDAEHGDACGFGTQTVTLTAENAKTTGEAYTGAHVDVTAGFPVEVTDDDIVFYRKDDQENSLPGAPIETGDYIAKVTAGGATAEKAFQIVHEHEFTFNAEGDTLTATCNAQGVCDAKTLTLTLVADSRDWKKATAFAASVTDGFGETIAYTPGEYVYYKRGEEKPLAGAPILTGEYTAKVTVTVAETPYVLTKDFAITKPENGYTSGYEVKDGLCYDTFADAVAAAGKGDTIYWHDGGDTISDKTFNFNSANDITVDLCGKSFSQSSDSIRLSNSKAGVVTLTNGKVVQTGYTHNIQITGGKIVFGNDLSVYSISKSLQVADGASLQIVGGKYSQNAKPDDYIKGLGDAFVILPLSETNYKYQVVPHAHKLTYSASANVITVVCTNENAAYCNYKPNNGEKLTLTAVDRQETGSAYEGAQIEYSTKFPVKDAEIEYWVKNGEKLEGAPSAVGFYEARVTVGEATAVAAFEITHIHEFELQVVDGTNVAARCKVVGGSCDYQEAKTVTLNAADTKTFDGAAYAATFTRGEGFPSEDFVTVALEYWVKDGAKLESAPSDVGAYTVKMIVTSSRTAAPIVADPSGAFGVGYVSAAAEKNFVIVQADLANATIELNKGNYDFNGQAQENGIKTVKLGNYPLVAGKDYTVGGDSFTQVGSPASNCTYTVTFTPCGNFGGSPVERSWTITTMGTSASFGTPTTINGDYGVIAGNVLTITAPTKMVYANNAWAIGMNVVVPTSGWDVFTPAALLYFTSPKVDGTFAATDDAKMLAAGIVPDTAKISGGTYSEEQYMKSFSWVEAITLKQVEDAIVAGETKIVRTLKAYALKYGPEQYTLLSLNNDGGIRETEYRMEIPLANLVLPVPAEQTLDAGDTAIDGFQLQLGKKAVVTANAQVTDFAEKIVSDGTAGYAVTESGEGPYTYKNAAVSYQITYQFEGNDGNTPTHTNPTTYTIAESVTFANATLDGYEFKGWDPAKIETGTTGDLTVTGTFEKIAPSTITIAIVKGTGVADVQTNEVSVVGDLELPAEATEVTLTLEADALTIPLFKVITNDVTNVTSKVATYAVVPGLTYTFIAEEAKDTDPTVADEQVKQAIKEAIDEGDSHDAAVAKVEAIVGEDANQVSAKALAGYIADKTISSADMAQSDYVVASVKLETGTLITEETKVEIVELVKVEGTALTFVVAIDSCDVKVEAIEDMVEASSDLSDWAKNKLEVKAEFDEATSMVTITPQGSPDKAFMRVVIPKDPDIK